MEGDLNIMNIGLAAMIPSLTLGWGRQENIKHDSHVKYCSGLGGEGGG